MKIKPPKLERQLENPVLASIINLLPQIKEGYRQGLAVDLPPKYKKAKNIVVCAMGGSALPAEVTKSLFFEGLKVPLEIVRDYHLPGFVNKESLIIPVSYSGMTEETISCFREAAEKKLLTVAITSGGWLVENDSPKIVFSTELNPSNQPRFGLGYSLGALWGLLVNLGFLPAIALPSHLSAIKFNLEALKDKIIIFVSGGFLAGAIMTARNIINETAKNYAKFHILPEANHHLLEGLALPKKNSQNLVFVLFHSRFDETQVVKRMTLTQEVIEKNKINYLSFNLKGENKINQALEVILSGSFLAYQLALANHVNPAKTPWVDWFKKRLKA